MAKTMSLKRKHKPRDSGLIVASLIVRYKENDAHLEVWAELFEERDMPWKEILGPWLTAEFTRRFASFKVNGKEVKLDEPNTEPS